MSPVGGVVVPADSMGPSELVDHVQRLEALGYDSVWIPDMFGREIYVTCGHLLANTTRIRVASGIAHIYGRDAIASAQAARTLAELSGGRFIHGVGISHPPAAELRGLAWEKPIPKMREYLTAMKSAMRGGLLHTPSDPPPVPVYVAAHGPHMLRVAADLADGANTYMQPPEHTRAAREVLGPDKDLSVVLPCVLSTDPVAARAAARRAVSIYLQLPAYQRQWAANGFGEADWAGRGSDRLVDAFVAWGDAGAIRQRVAAHIDAGADQVLLGANNPDRSNPGPAWDLLEALAPA